MIHRRRIVLWTTLRAGAAGYRRLVTASRELRHRDLGAEAVDPAPEVEVRRSKRRTRTVSAFREGGRIVVAIPARMTRAQEREWVARMVAQLQRKEARRQPSDLELERRAEELNRRYLDGRAAALSVRWSTRQRKRWGSCTPADRSIRLSTRLQGMPGWVVDYVLVHELVHLLHTHHDEHFWAEVARYPDHERAKAFLDGVSWADQHPAQRGTGTVDVDGPDARADDPHGTVSHEDQAARANHGVRAGQEPRESLW